MIELLSSLILLAFADTVPTAEILAELVFNICDCAVTVALAVITPLAENMLLALAVTVALPVIEPIPN